MARNMNKETLEQKIAKTEKAISRNREQAAQDHCDQGSFLLTALICTSMTGVLLYRYPSSKTDSFLLHKTASAVFFRIKRR